MDKQLNTTVNGLIRDTKSNAILNKNMEKYEMLIRDRTYSNQMTEIKNDINMLKNELDNVKKALNEIANTIKR